MARFDIKRQKRTADNFLGGETITLTDIATVDFDVQALVGRDPLEIGGRRIEAHVKGYTRREANIQETDIITPDSGTSKYEIVYIQAPGWVGHKEFYARKVD